MMTKMKPVGACCLLFVLISVLLSGCAPEGTPRMPSEPQLWLTQPQRSQWQALLQHWSTNGHPAMQDRAAALQSFLEQAPWATETELQIGWYAVSPGRWSPLVYARLAQPLSDTTAIAPYSTYRGHTLYRWQQTGDAPVFLAAWNDWYFCSWQPSLLQDALLAQSGQGLSPPAFLQWQQEMPFVEKSLTVTQAQPARTARIAPAQAVPLGRTTISDLRFFPDFPEEGYFFDSLATPFGDQRVWYITYRAEEEAFLWLPDTTTRLLDWWDQQFSERGEMQSFLHQGIRIRQLLDDQWERVPGIPDSERLRNPFVTALPGGWLVASDRKGMERWIDYLLSNRLLSGKLSDAATPDLCSGWVEGTVPWVAQWQALIGWPAPRSWSVLDWHAGRLSWYEVAGRTSAAQLAWQYREVAGTIRRIQRAADGILLADAHSLQYLDLRGQQQWRLGLADSLQTGIWYVQEPERALWAGFTGRQLLAIGDDGEWLPGFPYTVPGDTIAGGVVMRGSDGDARFFWQEPNGRMQGLTSRRMPCRGWPVQWEDGRLWGHLQTPEEDVLLLLGPRNWYGADRFGQLLWTKPAPGRTERVEPLGDRAFVHLSDGQVVSLRADGEYQPITQAASGLHQEGNWLFLRRPASLEAGFVPPAGDTFQPRYTLAGTFDDIWGLSTPTQLFFGGSRNQQWFLYDAEGKLLPGCPVPSRSRPVLVYARRSLWVITDQGDRVVAYRWPG